MAPRHYTTPRARVRSALQLLAELDGRLRQLAFPAADRDVLVDLLAATRRHLSLALAALGSEANVVPWSALNRRLARKRSSPLMMWIAVVTWPARALVFVLGTLGRAALRVVYTLRVLWP